MLPYKFQKAWRVSYASDRKVCERSVRDCHLSNVSDGIQDRSESGVGECHSSRPPISIAPVESGAEVMIERDATTARSDSQLYLVTVIH